MGYYADGSGSIEFGFAPIPEKRKEIDSIIGYWFEYADWDTDKSVSVIYDGKYHSEFEDDLQKLNDLTPVSSGCIEFSGEDGCYWRFIFDEKTKRFEEEGGRIVYSTETPLRWVDAAEFVGQIIDGFEDFLEAKGIDIPNPEKAESEGQAIIYGTDYGELQSYIENSLINWGLLPRINPNQTVY